MTTTLVVVRPFATYSKGDVITDPATMAQILSGEQSRKVVRVAGRPAAAAAAPVAPGAAAAPPQPAAGPAAASTPAAPPSPEVAASVTPAKGA
jgi:hypothetical protein